MVSAGDSVVQAVISLGSRTIFSVGLKVPGGFSQSPEILQDKDRRSD